VSRLPLQASWRPFQLAGGTIGRHLDALFQSAHIILDRGAFCPDSVGPSRRSRGYLRAAQAYILISMPIFTSTIFGAFQAIRGSQVSGTIAAVKFYGRATPKVAAGAMPFDRPQLFDAEWGLFDDTRHTVSPTSSAINSPPDRSTAKPTGLPRA
jgi:hypothetical protein